MALTVFAAFVLGAPARAQEADAAELAMLKHLSIAELMNVEVTSPDRRPEKLSDATSAIQVITSDDIRRSGAMYLPDALRWADNLQVARKNAHDWGITARGFNTDLANKLLVLVDGRSVYTPLFSGVFWDVQDMVLPDVDRVEVISGPGATLWGANAVNGVINITSKSSKDTLGELVQTGVGTDERFATVQYGGRASGDATFRVYGKYTEHDAENLAGGGDAGDAWRMRRTGFRFDAGQDSDGGVTVEGDYYDGTAGGGGAGAGRMNGGNLETRWSRQLANDTRADLQIYVDRSYVAQPPVGGQSGLTDDMRSVDVDFQDRNVGTGAQQWVWGLGCRLNRDAVGNTTLLAFLPAERSLRLFSAFAQDEIAVGRRLALTLGTKVEHNDYTGVEYEPSVRVRYDAGRNQTLWAAISRAVRTPSRVDRDLRQPAPPATILAGNPEFRSESLLAYEAGYRGQIAPRASVTLSTYYNKYDDLRSLGFTPGTIIPLVFENNLEGHTYGAELSATWDVRDNWQVRAGYDLLREALRVKPGQVDLNHGLNETADPRGQFSLHSLLSLPRGWELDATYRWVDSFVMNNGGIPSRMPAYDEMDARLGWRVSAEWEISVDGTNLLHPSHVEYGAVPALRTAIARTVLATVTWSF